MTGKMKRWIVNHITHREIKDNYQYLFETVKRHNIKSVTEFAPPKSFNLHNWLDGVEYKGIGLYARQIDVKHNLEEHPYPVKSNSADMVVMFHILEHMRDAKGMVDEARRISRKWVIVSLPNELSLKWRLEMLIGKRMDSDFMYGHRYFLHSGNIVDFNEFCGLNNCVERRYGYGSSEGKFMPKPVRDWLANTYPSLFSHYWMFLFKVKG